MLARASRHPIIAWSIAWAVTGMGLYIADVFSSPRRGPLWVAIVVGVASWGAAGAATWQGSPFRTFFGIWSASYLAALWSGAVLGDWFEHSEVGRFSSAGFVGMLFGWAAGGSAGALVSAFLQSSAWNPIRQITLALTWGLGFLVGGYVGLAAGLILAQAAKGSLAFLTGEQVALTIGWGVGCSLGGLVAGGIGMAALRSILGSSGATPSQSGTDTDLRGSG
jgi:hypothetical protein